MSCKLRDGPPYCLVFSAAKCINIHIKRDWMNALASYPLHIRIAIKCMSQHYGKALGFLSPAEFRTAMRRGFDCTHTWLSFLLPLDQLVGLGQNIPF
jgi:hypothetical protein